MKCRKIFLCVCAILFMFVITGWISANLIAKPVILTEEEILYYADTAKKVWYEGLDSIEEDNTIHIGYNLGEEKVQIVSRIAKKQSVTVDFSGSEDSVTVNSPLISFWGCFFVYGIMETFIIYAIIHFCIITIREKRKKK